MRIKVEFTVEVDGDAWENEYGLTGSGLRRDVQDYAKHTVLQQLDSVGVLAR